MAVVDGAGAGGGREREEKEKVEEVVAAMQVLPLLEKMLVLHK